MNILGVIKKRLVWYIKGDIDVRTFTMLEVNGNERREVIYSFYFLVKERFSTSYQYHGKLGVERVNKVLQTVESALEENKKGFLMVVNGGLGTERISVKKYNLGKMKKLLVKLKEDIDKDKYFLEDKD